MAKYPSPLHTKFDIKVIKFLANSYNTTGIPSLDWLDVVNWKVNLVRNIHGPSGVYFTTAEVSLDLRNGKVVKWNLSKLETSDYTEMLKTERVEAPQIPPNPQIPTSHKHEIVFDMIPPFPLFTDKDNKMGDTWGFECGCPEQYRCKSIFDLICTSENVSKWWILLVPPTLKGRPSSKVFSIAVPVFDYVLHRVGFEYMETSDWDGKIKRNLLVSPRRWGCEATRFYEATATEVQNLLLDQIVLLQGSVKQERDGQDEVKRITDFAKGNGIPLVCRSSSHQYGTTQKELSWVRGASEKSEIDTRVCASAFCMLTYGMCYTCYTNSDPIFSLVQL